MKRILSMITFFILTSTISAQWVRQHPYPKLEIINDIDLSDEGIGFAVGDNAVIFKTGDHGDQWLWMEAPGVSWDFMDVEIQKESEDPVIFIGGTGLLKSEDGGASWIELTNAPQDILEIEIISSNVLIVGTTLGVFKSTDGGMSWEDLNLSVVAIEDAHILDEMHIWASSILPEEIWMTQDGGVTWNKNTEIARHDLIHFYDQNHGLLIDNRDVYQSNDGGMSWNLISDNGLQSNAFHIDFGTDSLHLFAALNGGRINYSTDGGVTWNQTTFTNIPTGLPRSVFAKNNQEVFFGGALSTILRSADQLQSIEEVTGRSRRTITSMDFISPGEGLAASTAGILLQTVDGGGNWVEVETETRNYIAIDFVDQDQIWAGTNQKVLSSTDQGKTWAESLVLANSNIQGVKALQDDVVIATSTSGIIYRSPDQGITWDTVFYDMHNNGRFQDLEFVDEEVGYVCGFNGRLLKTTDGGENWNGLSAPLPDLQYEDFSFLSGVEGWLVSSNYVDQMWHTSDGGATWDTLQLPSFEFWTGVHFITPDTGVVVFRGTNRGGVYLTYDGGKTWPSAQTTDYPYSGVFGMTGANAGIWVHGNGGNIEALLNCDAIPSISDLAVENITPCQGDTIVCRINGTHIDSYHWTFPAGWEPLGEVDSSVVFVVASGSFGYISVFGMNACGATSSFEQQVSTFVLPEASIRVTNDTILEVDEEADAYQWYVDGVPIPGATMSFYIAQSNASYFCTLHFDIGCAVRTDTVVVSMITTSVDHVTRQSLKIIPIPVKDYFSIEGVTGVREVRIYNLHGQLVDHFAPKSHTITRVHLPEGLYIFSFTTESGRYSVQVPVVE